MNKATLREEYKNKRSILSSDEIADKSLSIAEKFFSSADLDTIGCIHVFLSMKGKGEVDTSFIINKLFKEFPAIKVVTSVTDTVANQLKTVLLTPDAVLTSSKWGVPEPVNTPEVDDKLIDVVLMPLLAFDISGQRVGYGKGFYDRFLTKTRPDVEKIGISLFEPVMKIEDVNKHDIAMNACITPEKIYWF